MLIALVIVGFFAAYSLSRLFMRHQIDLALPLSPALLLGLWTFAIAAVVNRGVPLSARVAAVLDRHRCSHRRRLTPERSR